MSTLPPGGEYQQAPAVQIGWWLWLGDHWEQITGKRIDSEHVYYTACRVYRVGYLDAVLCRRTAPPALARLFDPCCDSRRPAPPRTSSTARSDSTGG
jgi:hypothetical protein